MGQISPKLNLCWTQGEICNKGSLSSKVVYLSRLGFIISHKILSQINSYSNASLIKYYFYKILLMSILFL